MPAGQYYSILANTTVMPLILCRICLKIELKTVFFYDIKFCVYLYNLLFSFLFAASTKINSWVTSHFAAIYDKTVLYKCLQARQS